MAVSWTLSTALVSSIASTAFGFSSSATLGVYVRHGERPKSLSFSDVCPSLQLQQMYSGVELLTACTSRNAVLTATTTLLSHATAVAKRMRTMIRAYWPAPCSIVNTIVVKVWFLANICSKIETCESSWDGLARCSAAAAAAVCRCCF